MCANLHFQFFCAQTKDVALSNGAPDHRKQILRQQPVWSEPKQCLVLYLVPAKPLSDKFKASGLEIALL